jgi:hypothetical protein
MTAYTGIQGQNILIVSSDPANPTEGQIWYNSTSNLLKGYAFATGTWASGGNLNTARYVAGGAGTQTAGLGFGGYTAPGQTSATEKYNGTSWTSVSSMSNPSYSMGSLGTQTAALSLGGTNPTGQTESYNGTTWTAGGARSTRYSASGAAGTQTAGLGFGNYVVPTTSVNGQTESYNGSTWTTLPATMNTARAARFSMGATSTAALAVGGFSPSPPGKFSNVESWNGSTWTNTTALPVARSGFGVSGTQTLGVIFGGSDPVNPKLATSLEWNGTAWSAGGSMSTSRDSLTGSPAGTQALALAFAGNLTPNSPTNATEEYTGGGFSIKTITTS